MADTEDTVTPKGADLTVDPNEVIKGYVKAAGANPAELQFPTDPWGFTSEIKKAALRAAGTVRGQDDKHMLLLGTLAVLMAHVKARLTSDKATQAEIIEREIKYAAERNRVEATPVPAEPTE